VASFRVRLWDKGSNFGRGNLSAVIDDAANIGVSAYANEGGEAFFTLPWNHPAMRDALDPSTGVQGPLLTHYEVSRRNPTTNAYDVVGTGILDGVEVTPDEAVFYGRDYLSLLETTISASNTSYTNALIGNIISDQITAARAETSSRVNFISVGTISATSTTATMLTSFQPRLEFIRSAIDVFRADTINRPIISVSPRSSATPAFQFEPNAGSDKTDVRLQYGGNLTDFLVVPNFANFRTRVQAVGQKREGASLLFSNQTFGRESTYGRIAEPALFLDVIDKAALDALTLRRARELGNTAAIGQSVKIAVNDLGPWEGYEIGDAVRILIDRHGADYKGYDFISDLYVIWGMEWVGREDGSEELFLDMLVKETTASPPLDIPQIVSTVQVFSQSIQRAFTINGDFETDLAGWFSNGDSFTTALINPLERVTDKSYQGSWSMKASGDSTRGFYYPVSETFISGSAYTIQAWNWADGSAVIYFGIGSNGTPSDKTEIQLQSSAFWSSRTIVWTPSADRSDAHIYCRIGGAGSIMNYLDAVTITPP